MGNLQPSIDNAEHIGPDTTGDNIQAKKVANYGWNGTTWQRIAKDLSPKVDFDYLSATNTATNTDTLVFKTGGSGGTTVQTLVITYPASVTKVSDSITTVSWS